MILNALKLAALAALMIAVSGLWPDWRKSAALAIGTCIIAALALHFVGP
jgi:hypothetical protein